MAVPSHAAEGWEPSLHEILDLPLMKELAGDDAGTPGLFAMTAEQLLDEFGGLFADTAGPMDIALSPPAADASPASPSLSSSTISPPLVPSVSSPPSPPAGRARTSAASRKRAPRRKRAGPVPGGLDDPREDLRGRNAMLAKLQREKKKQEMAALTSRLQDLETEQQVWAAERARLQEQVAAAQAEAAELRARLAGQALGDEDAAEPPAKRRRVSTVRA